MSYTIRATGRLETYGHSGYCSGEECVYRVDDNFEVDFMIEKDEVDHDDSEDEITDYDTIQHLTNHIDINRDILVDPISGVNTDSRGCCKETYPNCPIPAHSAVFSPEHFEIVDQEE